ncbi:hypothetical protein HDU89_001154, partial [Geranomyces variabilis]
MDFRLKTSTTQRHLDRGRFRVKVSIDSSTTGRVSGGHHPQLATRASAPQVEHVRGTDVHK